MVSVWLGSYSHEKVDDLESLLQVLTLSEFFVLLDPFYHQRDPRCQRSD